MALTTLSRVTADGVIGTSGKRQTVYAVVLTPAAAVATLDVYDGTSGAGTLRASLQAAANGNSAVVEFEGAVFSAGLFLDIGGAGASAAVEHVEQA